MPARSWFQGALGGLAILSIIAAAPAFAAETKPAEKKAAAKKPVAKKPVAKKAVAKKAKPKAAPVAAVPQDPRGRAIHACKEHVDRVMRSPNGTTHGSDVRVDDKGNENFVVAGTVAGLREGTHVNAEWECDVTKVGSGLMHTKTKLFLPR